MPDRPAARVVVGSDYPHPLGERPAGAVVRAAEFLDDATRAKLLAGNAAEFLGLPDGAAPPVAARCSRTPAPRSYCFAPGVPAGSAKPIRQVRAASYGPMLVPRMGPPLASSYARGSGSGAGKVRTR
jgi:hypothetical protein